MASAREIRAGPENPALLTLQEKHVSQHVWNGKPDRILKLRRAVHIRSDRVGLPQQIVPLLARAGFLQIAKLAFLPVSSELVTALVERWRPETHTFHLPPGECTITLQDVAVLVGLSVDGRPVTGQTTSPQWAIYVQEQLGILPSPSELHGASLRMKWLQDHFSDINDHLDSQLQIERFAKAYILRLIGGVIFTDHSSSRVPLRYLCLLEDFDACGKYAWGAAALSYLYRQLCLATNYDQKEMCGLHILVQLWAWERLPSIAPQCPNVRDSDTPYGTRWLMGDSNKPLGESMDFYRSRLDSLYNEFVWEPYPKYVLATLPEICLRGHESWRAVVPLICFQIVEWHQPDRAMRQFGMEQHIPSAPSQPENIHGITLRGKVEENWSTIFDPLIELWNNRLQYVCTRNLQIVPMSANHDYMKWYRKHTRRWITRKGTVRGYSFAALEVIQYLASPEGHSAQHPEFAFDAIRREAEFIFMLLKEEDRLLQARVTTNMPTQEPPPVDVNINMPENRVERQGLQRRRVREEEEHYNIPQFPARQEGN